MMNENVGSIMTTNLITVGPSDTLQTVKDILISRRIHHVPVVEEGIMVGLVSIDDLFKLNINHSDYGNTLVSTVMTKKLAKVESTDKIGTAAEVFMEHLFHALPVVDDGKLVGIVTSFDLLKYEYNKEYPPKA
ncbi:MAG: CBS domain-containing protein [Saprospiraceae bacterium]|jgi:CBS domain-containing protein|nr:CBS domain-containing protein [Saprospiraceae bacterium]